MSPGPVCVFRYPLSISNMLPFDRVLHNHYWFFKTTSITSVNYLTLQKYNYWPKSLREMTSLERRNKESLSVITRTDIALEFKYMYKYGYYLIF